MPKDTSTINGKVPDAPTAPPSRFDVPEFMVPKSIAEVRELARLIALAEWAPDSYRDIEANYIQQKIELAIMHGANGGAGAHRRGAIDRGDRWHADDLGRRRLVDCRALGAPRRHARRI